MQTKMRIAVAFLASFYSLLFLKLHDKSFLYVVVLFYFHYKMKKFQNVLVFANFRILNSNVFLF